MGANLLRVFFFLNSHKIVILSGAPQGAESKDLEGPYPTHAVRPLSTTEARPADPPRDHQVRIARRTPVLGLG
jgi:hypothetical protein